MAISSKEEFEALQKNLPENQRSTYDRYLAAIGMTPEDAAMRVAAQSGQSQYQAGTVVNRSGTPTYVLPAGTKQLTPEQLKAVTGETQVRNVIDQATGKLVQFNPTTGEVFQGDIADSEGFYKFLNPRATGDAGMLQAGIASGTFVKNKDGSWSIGKGGSGGSTTGAGFARLLARLGFDATMVRPGESIFIGEDGLVKYRNKTYQPGTPQQIKQIQDKINNLVKAGIIAGGGTDPAIGRMVGGVSGQEPGTKISDVLPPEAWPPGYKWDTPIPLEGIPATKSNYQLEVTRETLGPYYEQYAKMAGLSDSGTGAVSGFGSGTGYGAGVIGGAGTGVGVGGTLTNPYAPGSEAAKAWNERKSAYDLLYSQFNQYGLGNLVQPLQGLIQEGVSPSEFTIRLRETDAYKKRFAANQARIQKGLSALSEAQYIALEDQYQDIMRRYGLPQSYYARGDMGIQPGFEKFIGLDVSPVELEDRIQTAYNRVINANPEVGIALRNFYPNITNGDILAYALDPNTAINEIKRKVTAAEIGGAAVQAGLTTNESDAEYLARYGITKEQAQQGYRTISGFLPRAGQLSSFYTGQVEGGPYTQASAEREVFGTPGAAEEERKRMKLAGLETAAFSGQSGLTGGALGRERAGQF